MAGATIFPGNPVGRVEGWILDLYPKDGCMIVWLKTRDGQAIRLVDFWQQCFYIGGKYGDLINLVDQLHVEGMSFEEKLIKPEDNEPSTILKVPVRSVREAERLAERVLIYGRCTRYELYNVDINPSQLYMYEKGVYPFGYVKLTSAYHGIHWKLNDSLESTDYEIPPLREITLSLNYCGLKPAGSS